MRWWNEEEEVKEINQVREAEEKKRSIAALR
jgi:hypothetical protein